LLNIQEFHFLTPNLAEEKQAKADKKAKRAKKDKNAPKKPMSAFFCYQKARRVPLKQ
jgi:hypothetical protein